MSGPDSQIPSARRVIVLRVRRVVETAVGELVEKTLSGMTETTTNMASDGFNDSQDENIPLDDIIRAACRDELEDGFGRMVPQVIDGISASIRQEIQNIPRVETSHTLAQADISRHPEFEILSAKNRSLQEEVDRLNQKAEQTQRAATKMVREAETKAKETAMKLHKIILDSGLDESGPTDDDVEKEFGRLYHSIFQFVMKFCQNHESSKGIYGKLAPEAKNLWVVRWIANRLYNDLFDPDVKNFGFGDLDKHLQRIEIELLRDERVPYLDVVEWRVRTCNLSKLGDPEGRFASEHSEMLAKDFYPKLGPYLPKQNRPRDTGIALEHIFLQGFHTSMLLRRAKVQYLWFQKDREQWTRTLGMDDVELVGTVKYESFDQALQEGKDYKTIFGEVVKGDDASGRVTTESHLLRKCMVLLGPIPKAATI